MKHLKADLTDEMLGTHNAALALVKSVAAAKTTSKYEFLKVINAHSLKEQKVSILLYIFHCTNNPSQNLFRVNSWTFSLPHKPEMHMRQPLKLFE